MPLWMKDDPPALQVRRLAHAPERSYRTWEPFIESSPELAANTLICLIHQANYLLDQQLRQLEKAFLADGGISEPMYRARTRTRRPQD